LNNNSFIKYSIFKGIKAIIEQDEEEDFNIDNIKHIIGIMILDRSYSSDNKKSMSIFSGNGIKQY